MSKSTKGWNCAEYGVTKLWEDAKEICGSKSTDENLKSTPESWLVLTTSRVRLFETIYIYIYI